MRTKYKNKYKKCFKNVQTGIFMLLVTKPNSNFKNVKSELKNKFQNKQTNASYKFPIKTDV